MEELVGKVIQEIRYDGNILQFITDQGVFGYVAEGGCCSTSWFEHFSGVSESIGTTVMNVEEVYVDCIEDGNYDCLRIYSVQITTKNGVSEVEFRNSSNGYYGGYLTRWDGELPESTRITEDF